MIMDRDRNDWRNSKYNDKVVTIKCVSKTIRGGRTMCLSVLVVIGDGRSKTGVGLGRTGEIPEAIRRGKEATVRNIVTVAIDENESIPYDFAGEYGSIVVPMKRAPEGTGTIANGPACVAVELAGIQNIYTKSPGSNNKTNVVFTMLEGLKTICSPEKIAERRGKSVEDILDWRGGQKHDETA